MFSFSYAGSVRVVLALALGLLAIPALKAQDSNEKFRQGADLYFRGHPEEALKIFQEILAENPSNEQALHYYNEAGRQVMTLMLVKGGEFETTAKRFLELATLGRKEKTDDAAAIDALVEKAMSGNYLDRRDALYALSGNHGEYGAAPFIKFLGDEDNADRRVNAVFCLTHLSGDAVLPLLAALESGNERVVWNSCACLGAIRDSRAVPGLKKVYETSANATVKDAANEAITRITGKSAAAVPSSSDLHVSTAMQFFRNDRKVTAPFDTQDAVWVWKDDAVTAVKVPAMLRHLRLAQQHCMAALDNPQAQAVLLAAYAGEKAALAATKEMGIEGEVTEPDARLDVALAAGGPAGLSSALTFALESDAPRAAIELIKALEAMHANTDALRAALGSGYKAVRYHAAFALAAAGDTSEPVVRSLGDALAEDALRSVLVIDDKSESRNAMTAALRGAGYSVITADSGGLGFGRARSLPPKDVVVVRAGMADVTLDQFVYDSDFRSSTSSIIVVADAAAVEGLKALYEGKGKVKAFLSDPVTPDAVNEAVKSALPDLNHEREAALAAAERAAGILGHMSAQSLASISPGLVQALGRTEENVLIGVLKAVAALGPAEAAPAVAAIFADTARSEPIRVAAADALGGIFSKMRTAPAEDVLKPVLDAAKSESNAAVRLAAGRALGAAAFLSPAERAEILR